MEISEQGLEVSSPDFRAVPVCDSAGLPPPSEVRAYEAFRQLDGSFVAILVSSDGDVEEIGAFPTWGAILKDAGGYVDRSQWPHWEMEV